MLPLPVSLQVSRNSLYTSGRHMFFIVFLLSSKELVILNTDVAQGRGSGGPLASHGRVHQLQHQLQSPGIVGRDDILLAVRLRKLISSIDSRRFKTYRPPRRGEKAQGDHRCLHAIILIRLQEVHQGWDPPRLANVVLDLLVALCLLRSSRQDSELGASQGADRLGVLGPWMHPLIKGPWRHKRAKRKRSLQGLGSMACGHSKDIFHIRCQDRLTTKGQTPGLDKHLGLKTPLFAA